MQKNMDKRVNCLAKDVWFMQKNMDKVHGHIIVLSPG
jgi:hypothetical protein